MSAWLAGLLATVLVLISGPVDPRRRLRRLAQAPVAASRGGLGWRVRPRWRRAREPTDLVEVVNQLAGLTRGGTSVATAWQQLVALGGTDELAVVLDAAAAAARAGRPVAPLLHVVPACLELAATWEVLERTGAPCSDALERLAQALADDADALAAVDSAMAGPRSTARVLAGLPVVAVGFGYLLGTDPLRVLLASGWGRVSLGVGICCALLGWVWVRRLVDVSPGGARVSGLLR